MLCETWQEGLPSVCFEEVVQNSVGKPAYDVAKAYHPIGLLDTLCKLFSTLVAADLLDLMEKHQLFPPMQFGSRPGCNTTDSIHPVTQRIKDSWWKKQTALILFLDIQAAFPNMVKEHLLHNMRTRQIPTACINLIKNMLSDHKTQFRFDDYTSGPIELNNRTIQGCPLSMLIYTSYNADLINIAKGKCKLSTRFVDDYIFVATGNNIQDTHQTLKNMMERVEGSLDWLHNHNSPFRLSKFACMDFLRPNTSSTTCC